MSIPKLNPSTKNMQNKNYETVVHQLLADELYYRFECSGQDGSAWYEESVATLDKLLEKAKMKLASLDVKDWKKANRKEAKAALKAIDQVLYESGYAVCVETEYLSTTLGTPKPLRSQNSSAINLTSIDGEGTCYLIRRPQYRDEAIRKNWSNGIKPFDCDVGAILYIAIAQQNLLPLTFIEVPNHNFVRWRFKNGSYFNWDTNDAESYSDDDYRMTRPRTTSTRFTPEQEKLNRYLVDLKIEEIRGYFAGLLISLVESGDCIEELYELSAPYIKSNATALNNFAWAFSTRAHFKGTKYASIAVELAKQATDMDPNCNFWDTFSCAYAAYDDFPEAIRIEMEKISPDSPRIAKFRNGEDCFDPSVADDGGC